MTDRLTDRYTMTDLQPGLLLQYHRALLQVSTIYPERGSFTATVVLDHDGKPPTRTVVRSYMQEVLKSMVEPSTNIIHRYEKAYSRE